MLQESIALVKIVYKINVFTILAACFKSKSSVFVVQSFAFKG